VGTGAMKRRVWAVLVAIVILATACQAQTATPPQDGPKGVRHGTLRVLDQADVEALDPGVAYGAADLAILRGLVRTLYSFDSSRQDESALDPVPDLADGPYQLSPDGRTYTFRIRQGIRYAQPYDATVRADDFVYAIERQFNPRSRTHSPNPYAGLIKGVAEYAAGRAKTISGMGAVSDDLLEITLREPASDFPSLLTMPFFSPVPRRYASGFQLGADYAKHLIASGPYALASYVPGKLIELVRNQNWDQLSDPLRKAWVDRVQVRIGSNETAIQEALEAGDVDLNLDLTAPPNADLQRLEGDPDLRNQSAIKTTGCVRYLTLQTDSGPTANPLVRKAINLAVDKRALVLELGGAYAGEPASTILSPTLGGYERYPDPYGTTDSRGDPVAAKALLSQAGDPNGITLNYVGSSTGKGPAALSVIRTSLARAGIRLDPKQYDGYKVYTDSLQLQSKKSEHQIGLARWCPDVPGNGARSFIGVLLDGRKITAKANNNYGDYNNPVVNAMIDRAYATENPAVRNGLWGQIDRKIMDDAAWVPLVYERQTYFWSSRVKQWRFSPWISNPDITNLWLDPNTP
jgi:peptide/nickel transport system substrate-binding protein